MNTYEQQREQFNLALADITSVPPTGYGWESFRDQHIEQVEVYNGDDGEQFNRACQANLAVARTALAAWYSHKQRAVAIERGRKTAGIAEIDTGDEDDVVDHITDLLLWAHTEGLNVEVIIDRASSHFQSEAI